MQMCSFQRISQHFCSNHYKRLFNKNQLSMRKLSLLSLLNLLEVLDHFIIKTHQRHKSKNQKKLQRNQLKNLLFQMVDGNVACATTTTSRVEPNASDVKKSGTKKTTKENQNTLDRWKTKRPKPSLPEKTVRINQDLNSIKILITKWLKNME